MRVSDYIVGFLIHKGVTDVFGIPGGVILDLLYAFDKKKEEIEAHLNYHEQGAAYSACGFAQTSHTLGVAYATCGPGITNMITSIADAYYDSVPVLFITAYAHINKYQGMRTEVDQAFDTVNMLSNITKYAARVEYAKDVRYELERAYYMATQGRKGPVFLDFSSAVFSEEINADDLKPFTPRLDIMDNFTQIKDGIRQALSISRRPVILIGDGVRQSCTMPYIARFAETNQIPVLSSRFSQDVMPKSPMYFGYIGSHGMRYSNFILSKTDLIISLGNRMAFNTASKSFASVISNAKIIRIDIDENEFLRDIPGSLNFKTDLNELMPQLTIENFIYAGGSAWLSVCNRLKEELYFSDTAFPINVITRILNAIDSAAVITSDVGNNNLWLSRAYFHSSITNRIIYSKSFKTAGCSLAKAIGAYFFTRKQVVCFLGDQGVQMNIQELQFIAKYKLPIIIVLLNNSSSGMLRTEEKKRYNSHFVHTTLDSGYSVPDFASVITAYGISYHYLDERISQERELIIKNASMPCVIDLKIDDSIDLFQHLPKGRKCQDFDPPLAKELYELLDSL